MNQDDLIKKQRTQINNANNKKAEYRHQIWELTEKNKKLGNELERNNEQLTLITKLLSNLNELMKITIDKEKK